MYCISRNLQFVSIVSLTFFHFVKWCKKLLPRKKKKKIILSYLNSIQFTWIYDKSNCSVVLKPFFFETNSSVLSKGGKKHYDLRFVLTWSLCISPRANSVSAGFIFWFLDFFLHSTSGSWINVRKTLRRKAVHL